MLLTAVGSQFSLWSKEEISLGRSKRGRNFSSKYYSRGVSTNNVRHMYCMTTLVIRSCMVSHAVNMPPLCAKEICPKVQISASQHAILPWMWRERHKGQLHDSLQVFDKGLPATKKSLYYFLRCYTMLYGVTSRCKTLVATLRYTCKTLHYVVRRYTKLKDVTLYVERRYITLKDVTLRWKTLHYTL